VEDTSHHLGEKFGWCRATGNRVTGGANFYEKRSFPRIPGHGGMASDCPGQNPQICE